MRLSHACGARILWGGRLLVYAVYAPSLVGTALGCAGRVICGRGGTIMGVEDKCQVTGDETIEQILECGTLFHAHSFSTFQFCIFSILWTRGLPVRKNTKLRQNISATGARAESHHRSLTCVRAQRPYGGNSRSLQGGHPMRTPK